MVGVNGRRGVWFARSPWPHDLPTREISPGAPHLGESGAGKMRGDPRPCRPIPGGPPPSDRQRPRDQHDDRDNRNNRDKRDKRVRHRARAAPAAARSRITPDDTVRA